MCGIVGVITAFSNGFSTTETDLLTNMIFLDTLRGVDSTGVVGVNKLGNVVVHKEASMGPKFINTAEYQSFKQEMLRNGVFAFGHNRAATRGTVNDENAHPFIVEDKIILMQNGTYRGDHKHLKDVEVDSHAIAHVLYDEPDIEKALQKINAAYTLVWYDVRTSTLNLIRNSERPLYVAVTKSGGILFASEPEFILFAASRAGAPLKSKPWSVHEDTLIQYKFSDNGQVESSETKIDNKYRGYPFRRDDDDIDYQAWWEHFPHSRKHDKEDPPFTRNKAATSVNDPLWGAHDVTLPFANHVHRGAFTKDYGVSLKRAEDIRDTLNSRNGRSAVIELFDYKPANMHPNCQKWFIVGHLLGEEDTKALIYFTLEGSEQDAINKTTFNGFMRGQLGSPIVNKLDNNEYVIYTLLFAHEEVIAQTYETQ